MTSSIKEYFKSFNILTDSEIEDLIQRSVKRELNKADYFIKEGEICKEVAFIVSGTFRSFYVSKEGDEITYCITFPNNLMTAYSSFITGGGTPENIQAMTPASLLIVPKYEIDNLAAKNLNWMLFLKIVAEQQYVELEKRVFQLQRDSAVERYADLMKHHPEFIQNIPL